MDNRSTIPWLHPLSIFFNGQSIELYNFFQIIWLSLSSTYPRVRWLPFRLVAGTKLFFFSSIKIPTLIPSLCRAYKVVTYMGADRILFREGEKKLSNTLLPTVPIVLYAPRWWNLLFVKRFPLNDDLELLSKLTHD